MTDKQDRSDFYRSQKPEDHQSQAADPDEIEFEVQSAQDDQQYDSRTPNGANKSKN